MSSLLLQVFTDQNFCSAFLQTVIIILLGFFFRRKNYIAKEAKSVVTTLVWKVSVPCFAFNAFMQDFDPAGFTSGIQEFLLSFFFFTGLIVIGWLLYLRKNPERAVLAGLFMSIGQVTLFAMPLLQSVYSGKPGEDKVLLYISLISIVFRVFVYIVSFALISGEKITRKTVGPTLKKVFLTPIMIGMVLGILVFLLQMKVPVLRIDRSMPVLYRTVRSLSGLLSPLAMFLIGLSLGESDFSDSFRDRDAWLVAVLRNVVAPVLVLCICLGLHYCGIIRFTEYSLVTLVIAFSAPVSVTLSVFCMQFGRDEQFASRTCLLSTLLTAASMPAMFMLCYWVAPGL
ncbi:MAG: AEC family transporter [Treponemataceae bacterium]|nr:AEC family transporter [Treponemataceae bacterium]